MSTKKITVRDFCAHAAEEVASVEAAGTVLELTREGRIVAFLTPAPQPLAPEARSRADWIGSGLGTVAFAPGFDPDEPAFAPEEWEEFKKPSDD